VVHPGQRFWRLSDLQLWQSEHKQIVLQWIPGHCQIAVNEYADTLAKEGAKITQTHIRETSYHSIKLHLKQVFRSAYRQELGTKLSQKPWTQKLAKIPDCPRRKEFAEFRLCVGHDCLGTHLHRTEIRPDPYCMLCSLHETMDRNHLGRYTALSSGTECERYWEVGFTLSQATKALRESRGIALLYFRPLH